MMKISIITLANKIDDFLKISIQSVADQNYPDFEHIVIIPTFLARHATLEKSKSLLCVGVSSPVSSEGLLKGISSSSGNVIGILYPGCTYEKGIFPLVAEKLETEYLFLAGNIRITDKKNESGYTNVPRMEFDSIIKHWEYNSHLMNPAGYFFAKKLLNHISSLPLGNYTTNLEFLLDIAQDYSDKIYTDDRICAEVPGEYLEDNDLDLWAINKFEFLERFLAKENRAYRDKYRAEQIYAYQLKRTGIIRNKILKGEFDPVDYIDRISFFPDDENRLDTHIAFAENSHLVSKGDVIVSVLSPGKVGSTSIVTGLQDALKERAVYPVFHLHAFRRTVVEIKESYTLNRYALGHYISGNQLHEKWKRQGGDFTWKFISGVRDPISWIISAIFENYYDFEFSCRKDFYKKIHQIQLWDWISDYFDQQFKKVLGIDVYETPFDKEKGYTIIKTGNIEILVYTLEQLNDVVEEAIFYFLGIPNFKITRINRTEEKPYKKSYKKAISLLERSFSRDEADKFYSHKVATHFYTPEKIEEFQARWLSPEAKDE